MYTVGSLVPIAFAVLDADGRPTNAATVSLTINQPDGTPVGPTVTNPPAETGVYAYDFPATQPGRHWWTATTVGPTAVYPPVAFHISPLTAGIIGLDDAKKHLNKSLADTTDDMELLEVINGTTEVVEDAVGPVVVKTYSEVDEDGGSLLALGHCPVISLTSLVAIRTGGTNYTVGDLDLDGATGIVRRKDGRGFTGPLRITYVAGRPIVPQNIIEGTKVIVAHAWETQRGHTGSRPGFGDEALISTPSGFLIPRRAGEWLNPHRKPLLAA